MSAEAKKKRTRIISFEGTDGVGKTTQVQMLLEGLTRSGRRATSPKLPMARTATGRVIYGMLGSGSARRWPNAFQAIQLVDKLVPQLACLPFLLATQDYVVFDRWSTSSVVYGRVTGVPEPFLRLCERVLTRPDAVIIMSGALHGRAREDDSYERSRELQARAREEYAAWARRNADIAVEVDASGPPEAVSSRIWGALVDREVV